MFFLGDKCPSCQQRGQKVTGDSMIHHVKDISKIDNVTYSFCSTPECDVVYYYSKQTFTTNMVNKEIGLKSSSSDQGTICYCYGYPKSELEDKSLMDKISIRIDNYGNRCDLRHPAGRCCLKDIKKILKDRKEENLNDLFKKK
ncbi:MAG: hypothetical protein U9Q90_07025 [Campylobacterota bacterium]|nr:hypothetical protein [Campylobacterota bacterium]